MTIKEEFLLRAELLMVDRLRLKRKTRCLHILPYKFNMKHLT